MNRLEAINVLVARHQLSDGDYADIRLPGADLKQLLAVAETAARWARYQQVKFMPMVLECRQARLELARNRRETRQALIDALALLLEGGLMTDHDELVAIAARASVLGPDVTECRDCACRRDARDASELGLRTLERAEKAEAERDALRQRAEKAEARIPDCGCGHSWGWHRMGEGACVECSCLEYRAPSWAQCERAEAERDALKQQVAELEADRHWALGRIDRLKRQQDVIENQRNELLARVAELEAERNETAATIEDLRDERAALQSEWRDERQECVMCREERDVERDRLMRELAECQALLAATQAERDRWLTEAREKAERLGECQKALRDISLEVPISSWVSQLARRPLSTTPAAECSECKRLKQEVVQEKQFLDAMAEHHEVQQASFTRQLAECQARVDQQATDHAHTRRRWAAELAATQQQLEECRTLLQDILDEDQAQPVWDRMSVAAEGRIRNLLSPTPAIEPQPAEPTLGMVCHPVAMDSRPCVTTISPSESEVMWIAAGPQPAEPDCSICATREACDRCRKAARVMAEHPERFTRMPETRPQGKGESDDAL